MKTRLLTIMLVALAAVTVSCKKDNTYFQEIPWDEYATIPPDMAVDMGICNHLKWRSGNLGAAYAHHNGDYYAWGETETYYQEGDAEKGMADVTWKEGKEAGYYWPSYSKFTSDFGETFSKYYLDDFRTLRPEDDVATKLLGGKWRMPTRDEFDELVANKKGEIVVEHVTLCGKEGWKFTSKVKGCEGHYIFLPIAGLRTGESYNPACWEYWSSSLRTDELRGAWHLNYVSDDDLRCFSCNRCIGLPVRPVCD